MNVTRFRPTRVQTAALVVASLLYATAFVLVGQANCGLLDRVHEAALYAAGGCFVLAVLGAGSPGIRSQSSGHYPAREDHFDQWRSREGREAGTVDTDGDGPERFAAVFMLAALGFALTWFVLMELLPQTC